MSGGPRVSIVIVTWNSSSVITQCLDALAADPSSASWEVVVVDNASTDGTLEAVREHGIEARLIVNDANRGLAAANNQGIRSGSSPFVLLANPDAMVTAGAIDALLELLERRPEAAFAVPLLRYPDGRLQTSAGDLPTLSEALRGRQAQARGDGSAAGFWWDGWAHHEERRIGRGHESCYLVRRAAIDEIGLQDERFALDWEGIDWAARAGDAGWEIWFTPAAEVIHVGGASIRQAPVRWIVGSHRGMYRYFAKRSRPARRPLLGTLIAARGLAKAAAAAAGPATYDRSHRS
jgi:N-acetylglucosaminyl-diphospho-decaprenol L-rhamnosyltransferase